MQAASKILCSGCNNRFAAGRGLLSHLRQTTNPRCKENLQDLEARAQQAAADHAEHLREVLDYDNNDDEADNDADPPQIFAGDFFGAQYDPADLPGWGDEALDNIANEDELPDQYVHNNSPLIGWHTHIISY